MSGVHPRLQVVQVPVRLLKPRSTNARTHSKQQISKIAASIKRFGFNNPILADDQDNIWVGHGRHAAAQLCGLSEVPVIRITHMSAAELRAYALADNRIAEQAEWDRDILAIEFQELRLLIPDLDLTMTGFDIPEIDLTIETAAAEISEDEPDDLADEKCSPVCRPGDAWVLGDHRLYCGSALDPGSYYILAEAQLADLVFTDPPYNVPIAGHASGKGRFQHGDFAMASGELSDTEFRHFLRLSLTLAAAQSKPGTLQYVCMDWRHLLPLLDVGKDLYELMNLCVWVKDNGGMGSLYRSQHELIAVFKKPGKQHRNNVQLGRYGRNRTNVWSYPGANSFSKSGDEGNLLALHPTVKPLKLVADVLLDCTAPGDVVLDPFLGSGTTLIAAERTRRRCFGIELAPSYIDTAILRWQRYTGLRAFHASSKTPFDEVNQPGSADVG